MPVEVYKIHWLVGKEGQSFSYELVYAKGVGEGPLLPGLVDVNALEAGGDPISTSRGDGLPSRGREGHFAGDVRGERGPDGWSSPGFVDTETGASWPA